MIYLKHNTEKQTLFIPREGRVAKGRLTFQAYSSTNLTGFVDEVTDAGTSALYFKADITLKGNIPAGEYEYKLQDEVGVLSSGLLMIGEVENPIEYNKITEYEQYN